MLLLIAALLAGINLHLSELSRARLDRAAHAAQLPYTVVAKPRPDSWWVARHDKLVQRAHQGGVSVLFLGDSITEMMPLPLLHSMIDPHAANFGIGGDGTQHLLWRLQNGELDFPANDQPKVVVILIGTNNIMTVTRLSPQGRHEVFLGVKANVDEVRKRLPDAKILVVGVLPREASAQHPIRREIAQINSEISTLADGQHVFYVDIGNQMLEPDGTLTHAVMFDLLHPTDQVGFPRMFNALKPEIDRLLRSTP